MSEIDTEIAPETEFEIGEKRDFRFTGPDHAEIAFEEFDGENFITKTVMKGEALFSSVFTQVLPFNTIIMISAEWTDSTQTEIKYWYDHPALGEIPSNVATAERLGLSGDEAIKANSYFERIEREAEDLLGGVSLPPVQVISKDDVNAERDKREQAGFTFNSKTFQFDIRSKTNISGAAQMAFMAIVNGAEAGDYRWNGGDEDFSWIAADNSMMKMDAQTVVAFGQTAAAHEQSHVMAARAIKEMQPIPLDYDDNERWPKSVDEI